MIKRGKISSNSTYYRKGGGDKMKKALFVFFALISVLILNVGVFAQETKTAGTSANCAAVDTDDMRYGKSPFNKLGRGAINTATCWLEVPAEVCRVTAEKNALVGYTLGLTEGFFTTLLRGFTGIFDVATFIIPPYNKPLMQPEYAMDSFGQGFEDAADAQARP